MLYHYWQRQVVYLGRTRSVTMVSWWSDVKTCCLTQPQVWVSLLPKVVQPFRWSRAIKGSMALVISLSRYISCPKYRGGCSPSDEISLYVADASSCHSYINCCMLKIKIFSMQNLNFIYFCESLCRLPHTRTLHFPIYLWVVHHTIWYRLQI